MKSIKIQALHMLYIKKETDPPTGGPATLNEIRFMSRLENLNYTSFHSVWIPLFSSVSRIGLIIDNRHN
jgi:hypothetical protein